MNQDERGRGSDSSESTTRSNRSDSDPSNESTSPESSQTELEQDLAEAKAKAASYLDLAQRTQADFLNYKRRVEEQRAEFARSTLADVVLKVLPAIDDLDLAVSSLPPDLVGTGWARGVVHIHRKLRGSLDDLKVKPIEAVGKPEDPWQHESVGSEPSDSIPVGSVTRVVRSGYTLDGRVIRPAQVLVSNGPPESGR